MYLMALRHRYRWVYTRNISRYATHIAKPLYFLCLRVEFGLNIFSDNFVKKIVIKNTENNN